MSIRLEGDGAASPFCLVTRAERPDLEGVGQAIIAQAWRPCPFVLWTAEDELYVELLDAEPVRDFTLYVVETATGRLAAVANAAPVAVEGTPADLPDEGWGWQVTRAHAVLRQGARARYLGAFAVSVSPLFRGRGVSALALRGFQALARHHGLDGVIAPVRPPTKAERPDEPIETFLARTLPDGSGLPADPWLRTHLRVGGRIIRPARRAMVVDRPLGMWEVWLGRPLDRHESMPGTSFHVSGALAPVLVREGGRGLYEEPGVWVHHSPGAAP